MKQAGRQAGRQAYADRLAGRQEDLYRQTGWLAGLYRQVKAGRQTRMSMHAPRARAHTRERLYLRTYTHVHAPLGR